MEWLHGGGLKKIVKDLETLVSTAELGECAQQKTGQEQRQRAEKCQEHKV